MQNLCRGGKKSFYSRVFEIISSSLCIFSSEISTLWFFNLLCRLFDYIQGKNEYNEEIEMTAPVITQVQPSDGPFCTSAFVVSFYVPKKNQANPPPAKGLHVQKWGKPYAAVRQFGGFVADIDVGQEASYLYESLAGTVWSELIDKSHAGENKTLYTVAQYNSPFEFKNRVNEVWLSFDLDESVSQ